MAKEFVSLARLTEIINNLKSRIQGKVAKSGDTMTGNLKVGEAELGTNGYVTGTWFRTYTDIASDQTSGKFCILRNTWIYTRTTEEVRQELTVPTVKDFVVSLGTAWTGTTPLYTQEVTCAGLLATDSVFVDVVTDVNWEKQEIEYSKIVRVEVLNGKIKFYAKEKTASALSIKMKVVNK